MAPFVFSSVLSADYRDDLENLLFFNPNQERVREGIIASVQKYGLPRIIQSEQNLRITVDACEDAQSIFAMIADASRSRLIGCAVFYRDRPTNLIVIQLAVTTDFTMDTADLTPPLAVQLFEQVLKVARRIRNISTVTVICSNGRPLSLRVGNSADKI